MENEPQLPPIEWLHEQAEQRIRIEEALQNNVAALQEAIHNGHSTGSLLNDVIILTHGSEYFTNPELTQKYNRIDFLLNSNAGDHVLFFERYATRGNTHLNTDVKDVIILQYGAIHGGLKLTTGERPEVTLDTGQKGAALTEGHKQPDGNLQVMLSATRPQGVTLMGGLKRIPELANHPIGVGIEDIHRDNIVSRRLLIGKQAIHDWLRHQDNNQFYMNLRGHAVSLGLEPVSPSPLDGTAQILDNFTRKTEETLNTLVLRQEKSETSDLIHLLRMELLRIHAYGLEVNSELLNRAEQLLIEA